jgi:predicted dehydrogenase
LKAASKAAAMLKAAIIGCGKIADAHATQILRIGGCEIVAACDRETLMAQQLCARFPIKQHFTDVEEMLIASRPDVVHITTPPGGHFAITKLCLEHSANVYVEKPFTVDASEARQLIEIAEAKNVKLTAGHNDQFGPAARRMRELVRTGYLGEQVVHMESYYSYDLSDPSYARALLSDKQHWVRRLPGKLLHNIISHGIARVAEFFTTDHPQVIAHGFVSPLLRSIGENEIIDELRVIISEKDQTTAYFTFSSQMKPAIHDLRIYGSKNGLILDNDHDILLKLRGNKYKSFADKFVPPVQFAKQHLKNLYANTRMFLRNDFHMDSGMKYLIEAFYKSVREDGPLPISYREILLTATIMDDIFEQLGKNRMQEQAVLQSR